VTTTKEARDGGAALALAADVTDPDQLGTAGAELHARFTRSHEQGTLITPEQSARSLRARLPDEVTGQIWDVSDPA
jgi:3-oxoacyl-[acyl-carrier protein] reductase